MSTEAGINTGSEQLLEDALRDNSTYEEGYTNYGSAKEDKGDNPEDDAFWIKRCRSAYESSQTWFDSAVRRTMEDNMRLFNSDHPRGSRYHEEAYQKRSKLFRPKTRSAIRKTEAAAVAAFFATQDALTCTPPNSRDPMQRMGAEALAELLNYRLQNQIPWYLTCIGALQDAAKQGVVISRQQWNYREVQDVYDEKVVDAMTNQQMGSRRTYERRVVADHPDIILRPVENVRFSPAADWRNPLQSSPYLIDIEPYFVADIIDRAKEGAQGPYDVQWRELDIGTIRSALRQSYDPIRQAREGNREDRYDEDSDIQEHDAVWVHHNYMRIDGQDWYWATLGTEIMLTDPVPVEETTPLKERPYTMGMIALETHKPYPAGLVELMRPIQEEINDLTNLRIDNIRHVISPRYFIKRGTSVDVRSLLRNIPGGVTAMEDPQNDVHIRQIHDTTSSSFQEQDRLSVEVDELAGTSSQSSIAANHNINERVGNTQMLMEASNQLTEMNIRTFAETWVEPTLQQVMELERALESDEVVMAIVGQRSNMAPELVFRMLEMPVRVTVNVGFGATNPQRRLQKVAMAFSTLAQINPQWVAGADQAEVTTEVLGAVGFKNAERFFPAIAEKDKQADPRVQQLEQENQQLKAMLEGEGQKYQAQQQMKQMEGQTRVQIEDMRLQYQRERDQKQDQLKFQIEQHKWQGMMLDHEIKREQNQFRRQELVEQRRALNHTIAMDERQYALMQREQQWQMGQQVQPMRTGPTPVEGAPKPQNVKPQEPKQPTVGTDNPAGGTKRIASTPKLAGNDRAGVIARGDYGNVPFKEG